MHHSTTSADDKGPLPYLMIVLVWAVLQASLAVHHDLPVLNGELVDTDSYMRMVRVLELLQGGGWYNDVIARSNAPYGETLHWTRPFDLLLILGAGPLLPFTDVKTALFWSGALISPLLQLAAAFAFIWATAPLARKGLWFMAAPLLFVQAAIIAYGSAGRADHHVLQALAFILLIGFTLRSLRNPAGTRDAFAAGLVAGFGFWLSIEAFLPLTGTLMGLTAAWLIAPHGRLRQLTALSFGLCAMLLLAIAAEHPPSGWLDVVYDEVSVVHLLIGTLLLLLWSTLSFWERRKRRAATLPGRVAAVALGGGACLALLYSVFPAFFAGPLAGIDPRIKDIWLSNVGEMQGVFPTDLQSLGDFIFYLGISIAAVPVIVWLLWQERGSRRWLLWLYIACALLITVAAAMTSKRFAPYAEILLVVVAGDIIERLRIWLLHNRSRILPQAAYAVAMALLMLGPISIGAIIKGQAKASTSTEDSDKVSCELRDIAAYLSDEAVIGRRDPQTILTATYHGPELLYRTPHRVIATPYHRNGAGIFDGHFMLATNDLEASRQLMAERRIDLILLCPERKQDHYFRIDGQADDDRLFRLLADGQTVDGLRPLPLPDTAASSDFLLFAVEPSPPEGLALY